MNFISITIINFMTDEIRSLKTMISILPIKYINKTLFCFVFVIVEIGTVGTTS